MSDSRSGRFGSYVGNPFVAGAAGLSMGILFAWFSMVWPLTKQLEARENSLEQWSRINREEQEAISKIKTLSTTELRRWVATIDEQNVRYAQLQQEIHRQELALAEPAFGYLTVAVVAVLGTAGFLAWISRDVNADAARTLENASSVLPSMRKALQPQTQPTLLEGTGDGDIRGNMPG